MNRAARQHLLARMEALSAPLFVLRCSPAMDRQRTLIEAFRDSILGKGTFVLAMGVTTEVVPHGSGVRVVAGKGGRHRGIRAEPPQRIVQMAYPRRIELQAG